MGLDGDFFVACGVGSAREVDDYGRNNYGYIYFENGHPLTLGPARRAYTSAYGSARTEPNVVMQTGRYSARLDLDTVALSGYDSFEGSGYRADLSRDVEVFSAADLRLEAVVDGVRYVCVSAELQDSTNQFFRLIQAGRYVRRFDLTRLRFEAEGHEPIFGRFEVTSWPAHLCFGLDLSEVPDVEQTLVRIVSPRGRVHEESGPHAVTVLAVSPHLDETFEPLKVGDFVKQNDSTGPFVFSARWDEAEMGIKLEGTVPNFSQATSKDTVHEFDFELTNPGAEVSVLPLIFDLGRPLLVTGTMMLLCDEDGKPSGIPVQVSKNWHGAEGSTPHAGTWLRGYTQVPLAPGESRRFKLKVVYGYWGDGAFGAVSHSSLSLIGWSTGATWKWDETAIGAWGETATYDPTGHGAGSVIADLRPTFTTPLNGGTHNWTENVGGGDFLNYIDSDGLYQPAKRLKTCYEWVGPNLTLVWYSGISGDENIRFEYEVRMPASSDFSRVFYRYRYEFLKDVVNPERLLFFQMSADYYLVPDFTDYYVGDSTGESFRGTASVGGNVYKPGKFLFGDRWLLIDDETAGGGDGVAKANRGLIGRGAKLNGEDFDVYLHRYGRTWGSERQLFDLSSESVTRSYDAGDVVEGEVACYMIPESSNDYWGGDGPFLERLNAVENRWDLLRDELVENHQLTVSVREGQLRSQYPLDLEVSGEDVLAELMIDAGGVGRVPFILSDVAKGTKVIVEEKVNEVWVEVGDSGPDGHSHYQAYYDDNGNLDYVFSLERPTRNLDENWELRVVGVISDFDRWLNGYAGVSRLYRDGDEDGLDLLLEYVLGGDPEVVDFGLLPRVESGALPAVFSFVRRVDSTKGTNQVVQLSRDLEEWENLSVLDNSSEFVTIVPLGNGEERVEVMVTGEAGIYARLMVSLNPI